MDVIVLVVPICSILKKIGYESFNFEIENNLMKEI